MLLLRSLLDWRGCSTHPPHPKMENNPRGRTSAGKIAVQFFVEEKHFFEWEYTSLAAQRTCLFIFC